MHVGADNLDIFFDLETLLDYSVKPRFGHTTRIGGNTMDDFDHGIGQVAYCIMSTVYLVG